MDLIAKLSIYLSIQTSLEKAKFRQPAAVCGVTARQTKVLDRLLEAGDSTLGGGFLGGMTSNRNSQSKTQLRYFALPYAVLYAASRLVLSLIAYPYEKHCKLTGTSKASATRDLADLAAKWLLPIEGVGKAKRYAIAIDLWAQHAV